jgi:hypothetical protein
VAPARRDRRVGLVIAALAALIVAAFAPMRHAGFISDDDFYVTENPQVRAGLTLAGVRQAFTEPVAANWHPLTMLSLMNWLSGASYASFRTHPMPDQLEAFKLAERTGIRNRTMLIVLVIASIVGIESSLILYPYTIYKEGVAAGSEQIHAGGADAYNFLSSWLVQPKPTDWLAMTVLGLTFALNLGIMFLRARFVWCPLHPAGYVIGVAPGTTDIIWFPLMIAMIAKWIIFKQGGIKAYRRAMPFFIGLVLGEAVMGCFWPILSLVLRSAVYRWI